MDAWSINPYFCENANFGDFLQDSTAKGFFCSVTLEDIVPQNIGEVSARELVTFVNKRKDERKLLREKFDGFTNHLAKISNIQHAGQVNEDFVKELLDSKEQYKKSMDRWTTCERMKSFCIYTSSFHLLYILSHYNTK